MANASLIPSRASVISGTSLHETPVGLLRATWSEAGVSALSWEPDSPLFRRERQSEPPPPGHSADLLERALEDYFRGAWQALDQVPVCSDGWSPFFRRVYQLCRAIPAGQTLSYGQLAQQAGSPRGARAVGQAMATNQIPLIIPCHRVLTSSGALGGYSGRGGLETKLWLLRHERATLA